MGLETSTYIDGLVATNPVGGDDVSEGDDHIRLLKSTIKASFPNIAGAANAGHADLAAMGDGYAAVVAATTSGAVVVGGFLRRGVDGLCMAHLQVQLLLWTGPGPFCTLPVGYRPTANMVIDAILFNAFTFAYSTVQVEITTAGVVSAAGSASAAAIVQPHNVIFSASFPTR
jgi:hypothetical protein